MLIQKDGNAYIVKADNFINLQESKDYFFIDEKELQEFERKLLNATYHEFVEWEKTCSRCGLDKKEAKFVKCILDKGEL